MSHTRNISEKRLKALIQLAVKSGLTRLKVGDVEFELSQAKPPFDNKVKIIETEPEAEVMPTEDELLFMSTPTYDIIRAEREATIKQSQNSKQKA